MEGGRRQVFFLYVEVGDSMMKWWWRALPFQPGTTLRNKQRYGKSSRERARPGASRSGRRTRERRRPTRSLSGPWTQKSTSAMEDTLLGLEAFIRRS